MKKTILLIEDDPKIEGAIREVLGKEYNLETVRNGAAAAAFLEKKTPDLIVIDFDLKGKDGLQVFKELQPSLKVIMLSATGNIPLAVSATKQGVSEFLRKPIHAEVLKNAVEKSISREEIKLRWTKGLEWLCGESPKLRKMFTEIQAALEGTRDIILVGEQGVPKEGVAQFIHINGPKKERKLARIDLSSFRSESLEAHFWATLQELMGLPEASSLQNQEDLYGTIYLENLENLDEVFKQSAFNFFAERRGKIDKSIRAVIGICDKSKLQKSKIKEYIWIEIPPLRERKEDIPYLLELYLRRASTKFNKKVRFISSKVLEFLAAYEYPGNYLEFERMIEEAVLKAPAENLELKNFPLDFRSILQVSLKKSLGENLTLKEAKKRFEKAFYRLMLEKSNGESSRVARFLDIPKSALVERFEDLAD